MGKPAEDKELLRQTVPGILRDRQRASGSSGPEWRRHVVAIVQRDPTSVGRWMAGETAPDAGAVVRLMAGLDVTPGELLPDIAEGPRYHLVPPARRVAEPEPRAGPPWARIEALLEQILGELRHPPDQGASGQ